MSTTTATARACQRNRRPRPARSMQVGAACRGCLAVRLTVGKDTCCYFIEPIPTDFGAGFRLVKFVQDVKDGEVDHYDCNLDTASVTRSTCECPGFLRHGWHRDAAGELVSCKHLDALLKLVADGRLTLPARQSPQQAAALDLDGF
jgi:hypothetical protein